MCVPDKLLPLGIILERIYYVDWVCSIYLTFLLHCLAYTGNVNRLGGVPPLAIRNNAYLHHRKVYICSRSKLGCSGGIMNCNRTRFSSCPTPLKTSPSPTSYNMISRSNNRNFVYGSAAFIWQPGYPFSVLSQEWSSPDMKAGVRCDLINRGISDDKGERHGVRALRCVSTW